MVPRFPKLTCFLKGVFYGSKVSQLNLFLKVLFYGSRVFLNKPILKGRVLWFQGFLIKPVLKEFVLWFQGFLTQPILKGWCVIPGRNTILDFHPIMQTLLLRLLVHMFYKFSGKISINQLIYFPVYFDDKW